MPRQRHGHDGYREASQRMTETSPPEDPHGGAVRLQPGASRAARQNHWLPGRSVVKAAIVGFFWRMRNPVRPLSPDGIVTFAIPLIGRARASDWAEVNRRLSGTLASLLRQTDPRWQVVVCGQDRPEMPLDDPRLRFVAFPHEARPGRMTDKYRKVRHILRALARMPPRDGYLFFLDADDLLHPGLVSYMMTHGAPGGYLIDKGYLLDASSGALGYLGEPDAEHPSAVPFHQQCASCSAIRADGLSGRNWRTPFRYKGRHAAQAENLRRFGLHLEPVPFPAAIYVVNHGENMRKRRGKMDVNLAYLAANRLTPDEAARIAETFGLPKEQGPT